MKTPTISDALFALGIDGGWKVKDGAITKWWATKTQPSEAEINAKLVELTAEYDAQEYARNRATAFPSIGDQLDMQYWDSVNGTTTWKDTVAKVKSDNPKPD
jgi:hypothetical protein